MRNVVVLLFLVALVAPASLVISLRAPWECPTEPQWFREVNTITMTGENTYVAKLIGEPKRRSEIVVSETKSVRTWAHKSYHHDTWIMVPRWEPVALSAEQLSEARETRLNIILFIIGGILFFVWCLSGPSPYGKGFSSSSSPGYVGMREIFSPIR